MNKLNYIFCSETLAYVCPFRGGRYLQTVSILGKLHVLNDKVTLPHVS